MRNYFTRLNLPSYADSDSIKTALRNPGAKLSGQGLEDAKNILADATTLKMYQRAFTQYEAMRAAMDCIESSPGVDTNHWLARLNNFDLDPEDQIQP